MTDRYRNEHAERPTFVPAPTYGSLPNLLTPEEISKRLADRITAVMANKAITAIVCQRELPVLDRLCVIVDAQADRIAALEAAAKGVVEAEAHAAAPITLANFRIAMDRLRDALAKAGGA